MADLADFTQVEWNVFCLRRHCRAKPRRVLESELRDFLARACGACHHFGLDAVPA